jgi:hypothetical protein
LEDIDWLAFGLEILDKALDALAERWQPFPWAFEAVLIPLEAVNWLALTLEALNNALEVLEEQGRPLALDSRPLGPPLD